MTQDEIKQLYALLLDKLGIPSDYSKPIELVVEDPEIGIPIQGLLDCSGHIQFFPESVLENDPTTESQGDQTRSG